VGTAVPVAPSVRITDRAGSPRSGVSVQFRVFAPVGSTTAVANSSATTDGYGRATAGQWLLGPRAGRYRLQVIVEEKARFEFTADAIHGDAASILVDAAFPLVGRTGQPTPHVSFQVVDTFGNGVPGATVGFAITKGSGRVDPATRVSDADGKTAPLDWILGPEFLSELTVSLQNGYAVRTQAVNIEAPSLVWYDLLTIDGVPAFSWGRHVVGALGLDTTGGFITQYSGDCWYRGGRCNETATGVYSTAGGAAIFQYKTSFTYASADTEVAGLWTDSLLFTRSDFEMGETNYWLYRRTPNNMLVVQVMPFANGCNPASDFCEPRLPETLGLDDTRSVSFKAAGPVLLGTVADGPHTLKILNGHYGGPVSCGFWFESTGTQQWSFVVTDGRVPPQSVYFACF
jgi:hypothetical protein